MPALPWTTIRPPDPDRTFAASPAPMPLRWPDVQAGVP